MLGLDRLPKNVQDNISYVLVGVAVFALLFGFLIAPQIKSISQNKRELSVKKRELAEFERLLEAYKSLPVKVKSSNNGKSLLAKVDFISSELSLKKRMEQIKAIDSSKKNKDRVDVRFGNLNIKEITDLILNLKRDNIKIKKAKLKDNDLDGLWILSLSLEG